MTDAISWPFSGHDDQAGTAGPEGSGDVLYGHQHFWQFLQKQGRTNQSGPPHKTKWGQAALDYLRVYDGILSHYNRKKQVVLPTALKVDLKYQAVTPTLEKKGKIHYCKEKQLMRLWKQTKKNTEKKNDTDTQTSSKLERPGCTWALRCLLSLIPGTRQLAQGLRTRNECCYSRLQNPREGTGPWEWNPRCHLPSLGFYWKRARNDYTNLKSYCLKRTQNTLTSPQFAARSLQLWALWLWSGNAVSQKCVTVFIFSSFLLVWSQTCTLEKLL